MTPHRPARIPDDAREFAQITHRNLRLLLVLLPLFLLIVTVGTAIDQGYLETSISAYYGGPVRDVFVGVMIAIAVCLVAYQGRPTLEDYNLNGAGFYAAFVALVPTGLPDILADLRAGTELSPTGVDPDEFVMTLRISLLVVVLAVVALVILELRATGRLQTLINADFATRIFVYVTGGTLVAFLLLAMAQLWSPPRGAVTMAGVLIPGLPFVGDVRLTIHDLAAIFLIISLAVVVLVNALPVFAAEKTGEAPDGTKGRVVKRYLVIFLLMVIGPVVLGIVTCLAGSDHFVILLEWWEIAFFSAFWVTKLVSEERSRVSVTPAGPASSR